MPIQLPSSPWLKTSQGFGQFTISKATLIGIEKVFQDLAQADKFEFTSEQVQQTIDAFYEGRNLDNVLTDVLEVLEFVGGSLGVAHSRPQTPTHFSVVVVNTRYPLSASAVLPLKLADLQWLQDTLVFLRSTSWTAKTHAFESVQSVLDIYYKSWFKSLIHAMATTRFTYTKANERLVLPKR